MQSLEERLKGNGSFSSSTPGLRLVWSGSSIGTLKKCFRYYELSNLQGWSLPAAQVDLAWGSLVHQGLELYYKGRAAGFDHQGALRSVIFWALANTWDKELRRAQSWPDSKKNRVTLIRALVWYLDQWQDDPLRTKLRPDGSAAAELPFGFLIDHRTSDGVNYMLQGRLDRLVEIQGQTFISDFKTTGGELSERYFSQFSPDDEFSLYTFAGEVAFNEIASGIIVDALQVGATFIRSQRQLVSRSRDVVQEWYRELSWWLDAAEEAARRGSWPQNQQACSMYRGCEFRGVCSRAPGARQAFLEANFIQKPMRAGFGQED